VSADADRNARNEFDRPMVEACRQLATVLTRHDGVSEDLFARRLIRTIVPVS
jgi:hypothetical protein